LPDFLHVGHPSFPTVYAKGRTQKRPAFRPRCFGTDFILNFENTNEACGVGEFSIHWPHDDSCSQREQQVVRGQTAPRPDQASKDACLCSTWQGQGLHPFPLHPFPRAAWSGNGNPAGFRAFRPPIWRSILFTGRTPMNKARRSAQARVSASGSERRRRLHKVDTRWDELEYASLRAATNATGLTRGGYIRALVMATPGPRAQRAPSFDARALAKATAALNKVGSNLNQIARVLNSGGSGVTTQACFGVLDDVRLAVAQILDIVASAGRR
jgi:hypothetical protein